MCCVNALTGLSTLSTLTIWAVNLTTLTTVIFNQPNWKNPGAAYDRRPGGRGKDPRA